MSSEIALRVSGLAKCYPIYARPQDRLWQGLWQGRKQFYKEFWALDEIGFEVIKGETVAIIGRNGSGKSTLLQIIAGTSTATRGNVEVNGRLAALLELGSGFNPEFSGRENVYMNGAILGLDRAEVDRRFDEIAAFADIGDFIEQPVKSYSSGMKMRLAFAVSVCVEPEILIIDEALAVGDLGFQMKCMERLDQLTRSGMTLLFVSHDVYSVKAFCRRAVYLENGRVKASGSASDMVELYLLDMRDAQRKTAKANNPVKLKPSLHEGQGFAFGTDQGQVLSACFANNGSNQSSFVTGETVTIHLVVEYAESLHQPTISLFVHDHRMVELAGHYFTIVPEQTGGGMHRAALAIDFPANLNAGQFFLTIRLEERLSHTNFFPIDKQVGALCLHVVRPDNSQSLGMIHLPFAARPLAIPATHTQSTEN